MLGPLHKPALVIWGAKDPYLGVEFAERQPEFFDVARVVILPESGHWPFQDDPAAVERELMRFLSEQLPAGDSPPQAEGANGAAGEGAAGEGVAGEGIAARGTPEHAPKS